MYLKYSVIKKGTSRERINVNANLFSLFGESLFGCCSYTSSLRIVQKLAKVLGALYLHIPCPDSVSLCPDGPGTGSVDQAGLELTEIYLPRLPSAGIKGVLHHCPDSILKQAVKQEFNTQDLHLTPHFCFITVMI